MVYRWPVIADNNIRDDFGVGTSMELVDFRRKPGMFSHGGVL